MKDYIYLLNYYQPRNYFLRIFQFLFWFLSYLFSNEKKILFEKISIAIADSRAIMNLFSIIEKLLNIFSQMLFFRKKNELQKLLYLTYITSFCHISLHSYCFIMHLCKFNTDFEFFERIYNMFYTCTMLINLIRYSIELKDLYNSKKVNDFSEEEKEKEKMGKIGIVIIAFNLPLALNGTELNKELFEKIFGFGLNEGVEGILGIIASIMQYYVAAFKCLKEIKSNYTEKKNK